jgi:hypothetical protein
MSSGPSEQAEVERWFALPLEEFGRQVGALHPSPDGKIQNAFLVAQIRAAIESERSAKASIDMMKWTRFLAWATGALALSTIVLAIVAAVHG